MMIWLASHYCESTIDLFDKEEPHHLMAEGHLRQRDLALCSIVDSLREAIGTANQQHQSLVDSVHLVLEEGAELARCELLAFFVIDCAVFFSVKVDTHITFAGNALPVPPFKS